MGPDLVRDPDQEKSLSNWLNVWRGLFEEYTMRALDLANHKGEQRIGELERDPFAAPLLKMEYFLKLRDIHRRYTSP
jgi:hypothetical protein